MQRIRMSLPYYRAHGWEPVVLTVGERWQQGVFEPELEGTVPRDVRVVRTGAIPPSWARWFGVGNLGLRAWAHLLFAGSRLLRREEFDLVLFSNTQFVTFPLGRLWRLCHGVPYVLDVQDPWRTDFYERSGARSPPGGWKYEFARFSAWILEGWSFARASGVISVSPSYLADLAARYPWFTSIPSAVVRFGASTADLEIAKALPRPRPVQTGPDRDIHLLYTGASGPVMPHAVSALFMALRFYRERFPERASRLRFHFIGTSYVAAGRGSPSVVPLAAKFGVLDQVEEIPHRIGFMEALRLQLDSDVLLLPGSSDPAYSPSKVYLYYLTNRPILGLVFRGSVMEELLNELSCAYLVHIPEPGGEEIAVASIHRFFDQALFGFPPGSLPARNDAYFNGHFLADVLTGEQCALFNAAVRHEAALR